MTEAHADIPPVLISTFGRHLIGRDIGLAIRKRFFAGPVEVWPRELDFSDVEQATESCIDELLGTLARDRGLPAVEGLRISGASKSVRDTINYVLSIVASPPIAISSDNVKGLFTEMTSERRGPRKRSGVRNKK